MGYVRKLSFLSAVVVSSFFFATAKASAGQSLGELVQGLGKASPKEKRKILRQLRKHSGPEAFHAFRDIAENEKDWMTRQEAISGLTFIQNPDASTVLKEVARKDSERMNKGSAIKAVSFREKSGAVSWIKGFLNDKEPLVQATAALELARNGDTSGRKVALELVESEDFYVKTAAVQAIGEIGQSDLRSSIEPIAKDESEHQHVRFAAIRALKKIEFKNLKPKDRHMFLKNSLEDNSWAVRAFAVNELAHQGDEVSLDLLKEIAGKSNHPASRECQGALRSIEHRK